MNVYHNISRRLFFLSSYLLQSLEKLFWVILEVFFFNKVQLIAEIGNQKLLINIIFFTNIFRTFHNSWIIELLIYYGY